MRRSPPFVWLPAAVVVIAAAWPTAASAEDRCSASRAPGTKVVIASRAAVVYKRREADFHGPQWIYYGCLYNRDRERKLSGFAEFRQYFGPWALAGRYVAFAHDYEEAAPDAENDEIHVFDLRTGKETYDAGLATEGSHNADSHVYSLVLRRNASAAWISSYHDDYPHVLFQVWALETGRGGKKRKLDEGDSIRPHSLALSDNRKMLYWRAGSEIRSAKLR